MAIRLVSFDLDDTLWDNRAVIIKADQAHWQHLVDGHPPLAQRVGREGMGEVRRAVLAEQPDLRHRISQLRQAVAAAALVRAGMAQHSAEALAAEAFATFSTARNVVEPFPDAEPLLAQLAKGHHLAALTNGNADVRQTPLGRYFDLVLTAEDVGAAKPAPDLFLAALADAGADPAEAAHVGDHPETDVHGARAAGLHAVWFNPTGTQADAADLLPASATIARLPDLPGVLANLG